MWIVRGSSGRLLSTSLQSWVIFLSLILACCEQNESQAIHSNCKVAIESTDGDIKFIDAPTLDISKGASFRLPTGLSDTSSILCSRSNLILKTTDFLVVMAQEKPLMLFGEEAKVVIEMVNGQFRMRVLDGELSEQQIGAAQNAMNEAQSISQSE